jgi:hypothetical protein
LVGSEGEYIVLCIATGGDARKGEALLIIESDDHKLGQAVKSGLYKGEIEISVRKGDALVVHVYPDKMDSKLYSKILRSLLGKKLTRHFINVANDNIKLGGTIGRNHKLPLLKPKKVKRIVRRATSERRVQAQKVA